MLAYALVSPFRIRFSVRPPVAGGAPPRVLQVLASGEIERFYWGSSEALTVRRRASLSLSERLRVGDAVAVLVVPKSTISVVPVFKGKAARGHAAKTAFFDVVGFFNFRSRDAAAVVRLYEHHVNEEYVKTD